MSGPVQIRPMLAAKYEPERTAKHLQEDGFLLMQPKIDGMRVLFDDGVPRSRSWKVWTNRYLQAFARDHKDLIQGWDCEMVPGHSYNPDIFREAMSGLRSEDGSKDFTLYLFDNFDPSWAHYPYESRLITVAQDLLDGCAVTLDFVLHALQNGGIAKRYQTPDYDVIVRICPTFVVNSLQEIDDGEARLLLEGWEGGILRRKGRGYKWNRATSSEGALTKLKRFETADAVITGYGPAYENQNEATISALGYTARSAHKANLVPKDYLGYLDVELASNREVKFSIGVMKGFSHSDRRELLQRGDELLGCLVEFTHQGYGGGYDAPRTPVVLKIRPKVEIYDAVG